jgi:hypothetical protein
MCPYKNATAYYPPVCNPWHYSPPLPQTAELTVFTLILLGTGTFELILKYVM